jgi:CO/xanthine dehydrogenase FAD-binding subunit
MSQPAVDSPRSLAEAYQALARRHASPPTVIAGGTDLMVLMNAGLLRAPSFLDIWNVPELRGVSEVDGRLRIGATTTFTRIAASPLIQRWSPALIAAARTIGAIQIQNRATIGGNIVNGSPAGDSLPVLAAFEAELEIGSVRGSRQVPFRSFYTGYRKTVLQPDELLLAVHLPKLREDEKWSFTKVGTRRAQAISKVVMAARLRIVAGVIEEAAIGLGSVAPTVIRAKETERHLLGQRPDEVLINEGREMLMQEVTPITDLRSTSHYRRTVAGNLLARLLSSLRVPQGGS